MNKFEQFSIDDHEMSLPGGGPRGSHVPCLDGGGLCIVRSNASWLMVIC